ncbi:MAG: NUDIX domain-containing protein [Bacteroidales bacterium]|nr:NUDIX domain-containing protein [Bacteroidales bacterium]
MSTQKPDKFTIRVYAIIVNENNEVLVSDEYQYDTLITKFPGGGMEFGEGTIQALEREADEEFGQEIDVLEHFYTTDFFQQAMFLEQTQVVSIYYKAKFKKKIQFTTSRTRFDFEELVHEAQSFRWIKISELDVGEITFPIDKRAAELLIKEFKL